MSPGVIPEKTRGVVRVRTTEVALTEKYIEHVKTLAGLASAVSGAKGSWEVDLLYSDYVKCPSLAHFIYEHYREMGIDAEMLLDAPPRGSSDVGNVSHSVPTETIYVGLGHGLSAHTIGYREAAGGEPGHRVVATGGKILASCLADLLTEESNELITQVQKEFREARSL